ncbi:MAG: hypothetical protein JNM70_02765 [Anaerolineae bacterium]|nr:hypothetical protein [Anaerolineae bacterium]
MLRLKPFQTLGMKLRQFSQGRLRRYAQDLPVEQAEIEPNWQDASEQELNWPEGERPVEAGPEAEVQRYPEDYEAEYGEYDAGEDFEESDDQPKRTPPDLAAILNAHREYRAEEPSPSTEEPARRPSSQAGRRVSRQATEDAGERTTPPAVLSDLPRPRRSRESVIQELLGGRGSEVDQAPAEASPAPEPSQGDPEAFLQEEWTPDAPSAPDQPERWTPDAPMMQPPDAPQQIARRSPAEPSNPEQSIRRQPAEPAQPRERGRDRQMAAGPVSISEEGEVFPADAPWTPPTEATEAPGSSPATPPGDVQVRRRPARPSDPAEPMRRRIDRQPEHPQSTLPQEAAQPGEAEAPRPTRQRPHPEAISEETQGEHPAPIRRQPAPQSPAPEPPYYDSPVERSAPPLRHFEDADMDADTELIVPVTPPSSAAPPRSRPAPPPASMELPEEPRSSAPRSERRPASPPEVVRRSPENAPDTPDAPERPTTRRAESPERPTPRRSGPPQPRSEPPRSEVRRAAMPPERPAPGPVEPDSVENAGDDGGVAHHEVDLYQALLSQGLIEPEPPARPAPDAPPISRREAPRPRTSGGTPPARSVQRQTDEETMARLRGRPAPHADEVPPSDASDAETMARLRGRPAPHADEVPPSDASDAETMARLRGHPSSHADEVPPSDASDAETMARLRGRPAPHADEVPPSDASDAETMARLRGRPSSHADEVPPSDASDAETMARLRGRPSSHADEVPPSDASDAETMARLRGRPAPHADESASSSSTEQQDLMAVLGLPPETPVVGGEVFQGTTGATNPSGSTTPTEPEGQGGVMPTVGVPLDAAVARAAAPESAPEGSSEGGEQQGEGGGEDVDIDKLARDVYTILRDRLRIEQERKSGRL